MYIAPFIWLQVQLMRTCTVKQTYRRGVYEYTRQGIRAEGIVISLIFTAVCLALLNTSALALSLLGFLA